LQCPTVRAISDKRMGAAGMRKRGIALYASSQHAKLVPSSN
jgi:hypothetical protein